MSSESENINSNKFSKVINLELALCFKGIHDLNIDQETIFLDIVNEYNKNTVSDNDKFISYKDKVYIREMVEREIKIYEKEEYEKRKEIFLKDMLSLYKKCYNYKDDNNKDVIKFKKVLEYLSRSKLLVSRDYGDIESEFYSNLEPTGEKSGLLRPPSFLSGYAKFLIFLKRKYDNDGIDKQLIVKYIVKVVDKLVTLNKKFKSMNSKNFFENFNLGVHNIWYEIIEDELGNYESFSNILFNIKCLYKINIKDFIKFQINLKKMYKMVDNKTSRF